METITKKKVDTKVEEIISSPYKLMLHNDDYNSFEWVISCLIKICAHEYEQAEQCAFLVHYKGECDVKHGDLQRISSMQEKLLHAGLLATIEPN